MTRVAVVAGWYPSADEPIGGVFVRDQAEVLARRFDVGVVAPHTLTIRRIVRGRLSTPSMPDDVGAVRVVRPTAARFRLAPDIEALTWERALARGLRSLWPDGRPDILHAHVVLPGGLAAVRLGRRLGIPVVLTEHSSPFSMHLKTAGSRAFVSEALQGVRRVLAVGPGLANEILQSADVAVEVVPNVVNSAFFAAPPPPPRAGGRLRILSVGFHTAQKRFDILVHGFAKALAEGLDAELVIVGRGHLLPQTRAEAERQDTGNRIRFEVMTDRAGLIARLAWSDIVVSCSDHESFGLVLAEALAAGKPVLATASGGPEGFVSPDLGRIIPRGDADAVASGLLDTPAWLRRFDPAVARARMAERFSAEVFLDEVSRVYTDVIAE